MNITPGHRCATLIRLFDSGSHERPMAGDFVSARIDQVILLAFPDRLHELVGHSDGDIKSGSTREDWFFAAMNSSMSG